MNNVTVDHGRKVTNQDLLTQTEPVGGQQALQRTERPLGNRGGHWFRKGVFGSLGHQARLQLQHLRRQLKTVAPKRLAEWAQQVRRTGIPYAYPENHITFKTGVRMDLFIYV